MVKGKSIKFESKFQEDLAMFLYYPISGGSPYYPGFDILRDLIREVSNFISIRADEINEEIAQEDEDFARIMYSHYSPVLNHYHDLSYKSVFLMIYASFENGLNEIKKLLIVQLTGNSQKEDPKGTQTLLLDFLFKKRELKFKDILDLFSYLSLLEKGTNGWEKVKILNKIRNNIVHNASIIEESDRKKLLPNIKKIDGIEINKRSHELRVIDIHFLYNSIDIFQSLFDEIYRNSENILKE